MTSQPDLFGFNDQLPFLFEDLQPSLEPYYRYGEDLDGRRDTGGGDALVEGGAGGADGSAGGG